MLTYLQLQEIKNTIPDIEIDSFYTYYTRNGLIYCYENNDHYLIFGDYILILNIHIEESHTEIECYNGINESKSNIIHKYIELVNIAHFDTEYDFTEQQENEIINSIKEITFKN